jgi:phage FluMu protein Com
MSFHNHSSVLADDEEASTHFRKSGSGKQRAVHTYKKVGEL